MIKILHTSDWHLGKKLYKRERWPEQLLFLNWLIATLKHENINILIIAGDIFDTSMPPTYALKGLFNFYKELETIEHLKKVIVIGGNHDSGKLIETPTPLLGEKFKILGRPQAPSQDQEIWSAQHKFTYHSDQQSTPISFALFPFFRASDILISQGRDSDMAPDEILLSSIGKWLENWQLNPEHYNIFIGHHLFGSFLESGSEQGVGLSGLASLPLSLFENWDLLCLGHIHKPQCIKKEKPQAFYSGSPIPMRFSEKEEKSVRIYTLDEKLKEKNQEKPIVAVTQSIPTFRPLIQLESTPALWENVLHEKLKIARTEKMLPPFLELTLHFDKPTPSYVDDIREVLSSLDIELLNYYQIVDHNEQQNREKTLNAKQVQSARMDELFDLYLADQGLEQQQQKEVKQTYQKLMDEILNGDHP